MAIRRTQKMEKKMEFFFDLFYLANQLASNTATTPLAKSFRANGCAIWLTESNSLVKILFAEPPKMEKTEIFGTKVYLDRPIDKKWKMGPKNRRQ